MVSAELSMVTYTPQVHSMAHWAIHLRIVGGEDVQHLLYQANGNEGELKLNVLESNPRSSRHFHVQIHVSDVESRQDISEIKQTLEQQDMKNDVASWNCQDWVMEALEALNEEMLLDEFQYLEAKDELEGLYHD